MLDIVIVNWNAGDHIRHCLQSIQSFGQGVVSEVIVVDNASTDGSAEDLGYGFKLPINVIRNERNFGFGKACNIGAKAGRSPFILFLNPDAGLLDGLSLNIALSAFDGNAGCSTGIVGVQLLDASGLVARSCARFPTPWRIIIQTLGIDRIIPRLGHLMMDWDHADTRDVDQVIGAFFMVRKDLFNILNGFDERFFVYFEEVDFSYRANKSGWHSKYLADVKAFHSGGGTSDQVKAHRLFYSLRSRVLYVFKHFSMLGALSVLFATILIEPITRTIYAVLRGSWIGLRETWRGYGMLYQWLPQWIFNGVVR